MVRTLSVQLISQYKAMINIQTAPKYYDGKKQHKGETIPAGLAGNILTAPKYYDGKKQHKGETIPAGLAGNSHSRQVTAKVGATVDSSRNQKRRQSDRLLAKTTQP